MRKRTVIKKFLCVVLSIAMVLSTGAFIAYGTSDNKIAKAESTRPNVADIKDCIAYFTFDDMNATGGMTSLVSNGAKTAKATVTGTQLSVQDDSSVGKSLYMPQGNNSYLSIAYDDNTSFLAGNDELTISYWSKVPSAASDTGWVYFGINPSETTSDRNYIAMREKYDSIRPATANGENSSSSTNLLWNSTTDVQGVWKYVTVVMSSSELTLYVNGEQKATRTNDTALSSYLAGSNFYIGYGPWASGEYYQGYVDEFAVMKSAYTATEVKALYDSFAYVAPPTATPAPTKDPSVTGTRPNVSDISNCIAYFTFDDLTATGGLTSLVKNGTKTAKAQINGSKLSVDNDSSVGKSLFMPQGNDSYLSIAYDDSTSFLAGNDELTISYWSKVPSAASDTGWLYFGMNPSDSVDSRNYIAMREKYDSIRPATANGANTSSSTNLLWNSTTDVQGVWKYVTVVMSSTQLTLYVNGEQKATRTNDTPLSSYLDGSDFYIGYAPWNAATGNYEYYQGYVDEFAVMNSAYTASQVAALYSSYGYTVATPAPTQTPDPSATATPAATKPDISNPSTIPGCIAYFTFDDLTAAGGLTSKVANGTKTAKATTVGSLNVDSDCVRGKSLLIRDGDASYLSIKNDDNTSFLAGHDNLTISYWSKVPDNGAAVGWLYFAMNPSNAVGDRNYIAMREKYAQIRPATANGENSSSSTNLVWDSTADVQGVWKFVTVVMSPTALTLYVNGEQKATRTNDKNLSSYLANSDFYIGYAPWASGEYYQGYVDEFAVMDTAYTAQQVKLLHEAYSYTAPTPSPTPVVTARPTRTPRATEVPVEDVDIPVSTVAPPQPTTPPEVHMTPDPLNPNATVAPGTNSGTNEGTNSGTNNGTTPGTANTGQPAGDNAAPAIGTEKEISGATYKITAEGEVEYKGPKSKAVKKVTIPVAVTIDGKSYKVTSITAGACKNCKKLKTITVKSADIKRVGKAAFKGIYKKATFIFPKAKFAKYKKLFKGKGQKKTCKYKKK